MNKCPGPDGLTASYYKHFTDLLTPLLSEAFNSILKGRSFNADSPHATISMIPKTQSDGSSWTNFCHISLLNIDIKLLTKILSSRLNLIIGSFIYRNQVGFISTRQAGNNVRRAVLLAHAACSRHIPTCFPSLEIKKVFDTLSWPYLQFVLCTWGFGPHFLKWISSIYSTPSAYLRYTGFKLDPFPVHSETRQGCPLSPLLFSLAIEPLAPMSCPVSRG